MKLQQRKLEKKYLPFYLINTGLILFQFVYIALRYKFLNPQIPIWLTMPWGVSQLGNTSNIYIIPTLSLLIFVLGFIYSQYATKKYLRYGAETLLSVATFGNILLTLSALRIINVASSYFTPLIPLALLKIITPLVTTFLIVYFATPFFIRHFKKNGLITDPKIHFHPAMLLDLPSARGGGLVFTLGVIAASLIFVGTNKTIIGIVLAMFMGAIIGYLDDIQNTKPRKSLAWIENPINRILLQALVVLPLIFTGTVVRNINNPFNGTFHLDAIKWEFLSMEIAPIAIIFTVLWVVWIMNLLSWSNGVDGQYSGIIGISGVIVALITLRLLHFDPSQRNMIELAAIVSGASLGLLPYSWYPSKIMWGFGAISAGIALAAISVISQAKIATSIIVLTVPFLDGIITVIRRLAKHQSPFKGDRGHLHHVLLSRGWGKRRVAVFYWLSTLFFGFIGIYASDRDPILTTLMGCGVVAFVIIALNRKTKI